MSMRLADSMAVRARLHGVRVEPALGRRRVERLLQVFGGPVVGMGSSGVLCLRRLRVRLPEGTLENPAGPDGATATKLRDSLAGLTRSAARPAAGPVPPGAVAVLFDDEVQLLAALVQDWVGGLAGDRWWWKLLYGHEPIERVLKRACRSQATAWPAVLEALSRSGCAVRFAGSLDADLLEQTIGAIAVAFALDAGSWRLDEEPSMPEPSPGAPAPPSRRTRRAGPPGADQPPPAAALGRLLACVPEAAHPALSPGARRLLLMALGLRRAPGVVQALLARRHGAAAASPAPIEPPAAPASASANRAASARRSGGRDLAAAPAVDEPARPAFQQRWPTVPALSPDATGVAGNGQRRSRPQIEADAHLQARASERAAARRAPPATSTPQPALAPGGDAAPHRSFMPASASKQTHARPAGPELGLPPGQAASALSVETAFGGLFYLVNAAIALGWYGDFTNPARPGLALPLWDFLALAGRCFAPPAFADDPLAGVLAALSHRAADEPPGADFQLPDAWLAPAVAVEHAPTADGPWYWASDVSRLQILDAARRVVADLPRDTAAPRRQAERVVRSWRARQGIRLQHWRGPPNGIGVSVRADAAERWCGWAMPWLVAFLKAELLASPDDPAVPWLLAQRARIAVAPIRVDIHFPLDDHPIAIRIAGLDRDPGWVPAAGRTLAFHYD